MNKTEMLFVLTNMGFIVDLDSWDKKGWIRLELNNHVLRQQSLTLIWYKGETDENVIKNAANIVFQGGQKAKIIQFNDLINL